MKRIASLALAFCFWFPLYGCGGSDLNDPDIKAVRDSYYNQTATIGNLFDQFYDSPKWSKETSSKGEILVIFEGKISSASDKRNLLIEKIDKSIKEDLMEDLYTIIKLLVWAPKDTQEFIEIGELEEQLQIRNHAINKSIRDEQESALRTLNAAFHKKEEQLKNKIFNERQQFENEMKTLSDEKKKAMEPYMHALFELDKKITPLRQRQANLRPSDYRDGINIQIENSINELVEQKKQIQSQLDGVIGKYNAEISKIEEKIRNIARRLNEVHKYLEKEVDAIRQLEESYPSKREQRLEIEFYPFVAEVRSKIRNLSIQMVKKYSPAKGAPIRITWLKYADINNPRKVGYNIQEITVKGERMTLLVLP